jgi:hypothetical protein
MEIYVLINNEPHGPYTPEQIREYLKTGELQGDQLAAYSGSADWKPLSAMAQSWAAKPVHKPVRSPAQPKGRKTRIVFGVAAAVLVVLAGTAGFGWWQFFGDSGPVVKVVTQLEPGLPNTLTELNAWYVEPPEGQNAAKYFLQSFDELNLKITDVERTSKDLPFIGKAPPPPLDKPLSKSTVAAIEGLRRQINAANYAKSGEIFGRGLSFETSRYPVDFTQGSFALLPHLSKVKTFSQFMILMAIRAADAPGNYPNSGPAKGEAVSGGIIMALKAGQSLEPEPSLISQVVRESCIQVAVGGWEQVLNRAPFSTNGLVYYQRAFDQAAAHEADGIGFSRALAGQRAMTLHMLNIPPEQLVDLLSKRADGKPAETNEVPQALVGLAFKKLTRNLKSQRAFAEETFNRAIQMRKQPFPERLKVDDYFKSRMDEAKTSDFGLVLLLAPSLGGATKKEASGLAQLRLAQTAIALEQYRLANAGSFPATLSALAPKFLAEVPADPFDGQPLRYRNTATGYQLYSIGPDLTDDGGKRDSGGKGDLVFEVSKAQKVTTQTGNSLSGAN